MLLGRPGVPSEKCPEHPHKPRLVSGCGDIILAELRRPVVPVWKIRGFEGFEFS
jgi:hypothetical protein